MIAFCYIQKVVLVLYLRKKEKKISVLLTMERANKTDILLWLLGKVSYRHSVTIRAEIFMQETITEQGECLKMEMINPHIQK